MRLTDEQIDDIVKSTPLMDDKSRIIIKSRILKIFMAFEQENNVLLSDEWLDLWCQYIKN